ncbi:MAG: hypothetical protein AAGI51_01555, partial [Pseudomonadota bacterium]
LQALGEALAARAEAAPGTADLDAAALALREARALADAGGRPKARAQAEQTLARALLTLDARLGGAPEALWEAAAAAEASAAEFHRLGLATARARSANLLAVALLRLGADAPSQTLAPRAEALALLREVAAGLPREDAPRLWADTRFNLGALLVDRARRMQDPDARAEAASLYDEARQAYAAGGYPAQADAAARAIARLAR